VSSVLKQTRAILEKRRLKLSGANDNKPTDLPENVLEFVGAGMRQDQLDILDTFKRFNFVCIHRRMGKSYMLAGYMLDRAVECTHLRGNYGYFAATRGQTFQAVWRDLLAWAQRLPGTTYREKTHEIFVRNRGGGISRIVVEGLNHTRQRSAGWNGVVVDEAAEVIEAKWKSELYPALWDNSRKGYDRKGREDRWAVICGTPLGRNWFYRLYLRAKMWAIGKAFKSIDQVTGEETFEEHEGWSCTYLPVNKTKLLTKKEQKIIETDIGREDFLREFMLDWTASTSGSLLGDELRAMRDGGQVGDFEFVPGYPVHTTWDLGLSQTVIWFFQIIADEVRFIDAFTHSREGIEWYFETVLPARKERYGYEYGTHYLPHDAVHSELLTGNIRLMYILGVLASEDGPGGIAKVVERHDPRAEGMDSVRWMFQRCVINEARCEEQLDNLAMVRRRYDPKTETLNDLVGDNNVHSLDAFRQASYQIRLDLAA